MKHNENYSIRRLLALLFRVNIHPALLILPIILSILAALFEGVGMSLLVPLLNGFLTKDFSFITEVPVLKDALAILPSVFTSTDRALFVTLISLFVGVIVLKNILQYSTGITLAYFVQRALHHLRKTLFSRYLSFGKLYFDRTSLGHHSTILSEFIQQIFNPLFSFSSAVQSFFTLIAYAVIMLVISWQITLFALPAFVILYMVTQIIVRKIKAHSGEMAFESKTLNKKVIEILSVIPLVKISNTEAFEKKHYKEISDRQSFLGFRIRALQQAIRPVQEITLLILALLLFGILLSVLVYSNQANAPAFLVYFYLVVSSASKLGAIVNFRGQLAQASAPLQHIEDVLSDEGKEFVPDGEQNFEKLKNVIAIHKLGFKYPDGTTALHDVTLNIKRGKMTAIVGPTGSGKTTLINLLIRFYDVSPGSILIDGTDIRDFNASSLRAHIGLVSQDTLLLHETLKENITYGLKVSEKEITDAIRRSRLDVVVSKLPDGLNTLIGDRGVKLSGGEKQRVAIARALLKDAELLILDEATSALDSKTETLIKEAIDEAVSGRTTLVIAHRLSTIQHADTIVVLDEGKTVEQGTLDELLMKKGKFYELWEEQKFV